MGLEALVIGALAASTAATIYNGEQSRKAQNKATDAAKANALKQADAQDQATNRANAKAPDVGAMLAANEQAAKGGAGSTMLTGAQGIDPSTLSLGKNTLLGQ